MHEPILIAKKITKNFGNLKILHGIDLTVNKGEFVALVGKSGSGKTTLLSILSGLDSPTSGDIQLAGHNLEGLTEDELALARRQNVGFIFQSFLLIPTITAWENVALPLFPEKIESEKRRKKAIELLKQMELSHRLNHLPGTLSGGEKQRVAIARALINSPSIIFADEPTGNLDSQTGEAIIQILKDLHHKKQVTLVMVTHDLGLATAADRTITLKDGEIVS